MDSQHSSNEHPLEGIRLIDVPVMDGVQGAPQYSDNEHSNNEPSPYRHPDNEHSSDYGHSSGIAACYVAHCSNNEPPCYQHSDSEDSWSLVTNTVQGAGHYSDNEHSNNEPSRYRRSDYEHSSDNEHSSGAHYSDNEPNYIAQGGPGRNIAHSAAHYSDRPTHYAQMDRVINMVQNIEFSEPSRYEPSHNRPSSSQPSHSQTSCSRPSPNQPSPNQPSQNEYSSSLVTNRVRVVRYSNYQHQHSESEEFFVLHIVLSLQLQFLFIVIKMMTMIQTLLIVHYPAIVRWYGINVKEVQDPLVINPS